MHTGTAHSSDSGSEATAARGRRLRRGHQALLSASHRRHLPRRPHRSSATDVPGRRKTGACRGLAPCRLSHPCRSHRMIRSSARKWRRALPIRNMTWRRLGTRSGLQEAGRERFLPEHPARHRIRRMAVLLDRGAAVWASKPARRRLVPPLAPVAACSMPPQSDIITSAEEARQVRGASGASPAASLRRAPTFCIPSRRLPSPPRGWQCWASRLNPRPASRPSLCPSTCSRWEWTSSRCQAGGSTQCDPPPSFARAYQRRRLPAQFRPHAHTHACGPACMHLHPPSCIAVYYPEVTHILGRPVVRDLRAVQGPVDILDVFRRPQDLPQASQRGRAC